MDQYSRLDSVRPQCSNASMEVRELLYERLARQLASRIDDGTLRAGERLPSVRRLSRQHKVSISTVLQAYLALENRGLIETRPQSGHFVRHFRQDGLPEPRVSRPSLTPRRVTMRTLVGDLYQTHGDTRFASLGVATIAPSLLPADKLNRILARVARSAGGVGVSYDWPRGCPRLRRQLARRALDWGCSLRADDFIVTVGAMEALQLCLHAVTRPGDAVAVESPTYFGVLRLIEAIGLRAVEIPVQPRTGIDLDVLERAIREQRVRACVVIPNFHNPLGSLMPDAAKAQLVALAAKHDLPLIEDDIYSELFDEAQLGGSRPRPCKAFDSDGIVMTCGSVSKTLAAGYRVGWVVPGRFEADVEHLKFAQTVASPTLPALAIAEFLDGGGYDHHLRKLRRHLAAQVQQMREAVAEYFPPGTRVSRPQGGYVLWVEMPTGTNALELQAKALARGIVIAPGPLFSAQQRLVNCIRLNCGHPWSDALERAVRELGALARNSK
jgi:DNA-binding transcriptional MocR family regulator